MLFVIQTVLFTIYGHYYLISTDFAYIILYVILNFIQKRQQKVFLNKVNFVCNHFKKQLKPQYYLRDNLSNCQFFKCKKKKNNYGILKPKNFVKVFVLEPHYQYTKKYSKQEILKHLKENHNQVSLNQQTNNNLISLDYLKLEKKQKETKSLNKIDKNCQKNQVKPISNFNKLSQQFKSSDSSNINMTQNQKESRKISLNQKIKNNNFLNVQNNNFLNTNSLTLKQINSNQTFALETERKHLFDGRPLKQLIRFIQKFLMKFKIKIKNFKLIIQYKMSQKPLSREEKIKALKQEFKLMDTNNDNQVTYDEFIYHLDNKNVNQKEWLTF